MSYNSLSEIKKVYQEYFTPEQVDKVKFWVEYLFKDGYLGDFQGILNQFEVEDEEGDLISPSDQFLDLLNDLTLLLGKDGFFHLENGELYFWYDEEDQEDFEPFKKNGKKEEK